MSLSTFNDLPKGTRREDVRDALILMGYERHRKPSWLSKGYECYWHWTEEDYRSIAGIEANVSESESGGLTVSTRTTSCRSRYEIQMQNDTMRRLKRWFGGSFESDYGKNRYLALEEGADREKAEAGCYLAYWQAKHSIMGLQIYVEYREFKFQKLETTHFAEMRAMHPEIVANNMVVPYLVSTCETYARATFVALLKYSPIKQAVLKKARFDESDLVKVSDGCLSVEDACAKWMSFQDMDRIKEHFRWLNNKLDVQACLGRGRRRLWGDLRRMILSRHDVIHRSAIDIDYTTRRLKKDISVVEESVDRIYQMVCSTHGWVLED